MNLSQLRFAQAVAACASFSEAARRCHISQPSLSTAVAQLEDELGGKLFARTTRRVTVTPFGAHLLPLIDGVLGAQHELSQAARVWREPARRLIRVGFAPAVSLEPIHMALKAWHRDHPETEVVLKECLQGDLDRRLTEGAIDLALVVWREGRPHDSVLLQEEPLVVLPRQSGGGRAGRGLSLRDLAGETFVFTRGCGLADHVRSLFRRARVPIREYPGQAISYRVLEEWADLGIGAAVLPLSRLSGRQGAVQPLRLANGQEATIRTFATWAPGSRLSGETRIFLDWLEARLSSIGRGMAPVLPASRGRVAQLR